MAYIGSAGRYERDQGRGGLATTSGGLTAESPRQNVGERRIDLLDRFVRVDRAGAVLGALAATIYNAFWLNSAQLYLLAPLLGGLVMMLTIGRRALHRGEVFRCLLLLASGNWFIAIAVAWVVPFIGATMVLTALIPVVLATPHLRVRRLIPFIVGATIVGAMCVGLGVVRDDDGVIADVDDEFELVVVMGALVAQIVPVGLLIWQNNDLLRRAFDEALALNADLEESQQSLAAEGRRLAESRRRVVEASTAERSRIERDIHDGAQQRLAAIGVRLRLLQSTASEESPLGGALPPIVGELEEAMEELRELAHGIYPPLLESQGLGAALTAVVRRSPARITSAIGGSDGVPRFERAVEEAMYFSFLEALANIHKYCPQANVEVSLKHRAAPGVLQLKVIDDGPGFDADQTALGHGHQNMADRLAAVGGELSIHSRPGKGTAIRADIPVG